VSPTLDKSKIPAVVGTLTRASSAGGTVTQQDINAGHVIPAVATVSGKDLSHALTAPKRYSSSEDGTGRMPPTISQEMKVRRLTPIECERLQGFPDNYTQIPWRNKAPEDCPDGPRYKAMGNSMAVPVMNWIGRRIQMVEDIAKTFARKNR